VKARRVVIFGVYGLLVTISTQVRAQWVQLGPPSNLPIYLFGCTGPDLVADAFELDLAYSTDNGDNWQQYPDLPHVAGIGPSSFARRGNILMATFTSGLDIYPDTGGYYRSSDGGISWARVSHSQAYDLNGFASLRGYFFAINDRNGVWRSADGGATWEMPADTTTGRGLPNPVIGFNVFNDKLFAATAMRGIYCSTDSGITWSPLNTGLDTGQVFSINSNRDYQFVVLQSVDAGLQVDRRGINDTSWTPVFEIDSLFVYLGGLTVSNNYVVVGDSRSNIYESSDTGITWHSVGSVHGGGPWTPYYLFANDSFVFASNDRSWRHRLTDFSVVKPTAPSDFTLDQSYPNPATFNTTISFTVKKLSNVSLVITDELGRQISLIASQEMTFGKHSFNWDAHSFPSGIYTYRLTNGINSLTRKLILAK
jgi:photosystem II stability/assembly factor-like uncharacterized protein